MWLSLFLLAFLGASVYFQTIQGFTSAAIMCVLTILSLAFSFGTYEYVAESFLMGFKPDFAYAVAFVVTFALPLGLARLVLDKVLPRASLLPLVLDRAVGAVAGVCTAFLMTGVLALAIQMMPWSDGFLGFHRFDTDNPDQQNELWLQPDRVAVRFASSLSSGALSGSRRFVEDHPDFVTELGWIQSSFGAVRRVVPADSIQVVEAGKLATLYALEAGERRRSPDRVVPVEPDLGHRFVRVTLQVPDDISDEDGKKRYTPASVRLVGTEGGKPAAYHAVAIANPDDPSRYVTSFVQGKEKKMVAGQLFLVPSGGQIELAFELPDDFEPRFIAYKMGGRADIDKKQFGIVGDENGNENENGDDVRQASVPASTPTPTPASGGGSSASRSHGGRVSGVKVQFGKSRFGPDLPLELTLYQGIADVQSGALVEGAITAIIADQGHKKRGQAISKLEVPEGKCLLHLNVESLKAGSIAGRALNFAVKTVENYILEDDRGNKLTPVGKYAIAKIGDDEVMELQYFPGVGGRVKPFSRIKSAHLKKDYQLVYLYLMDKGAKAMRFSPSGGKRSTDLSGENLIAH